MTNDHLDDLLILQRAGDGHYQVWVAPSVGDGFGAADALVGEPLSSDHVRTGRARPLRRGRLHGRRAGRRGAARRRSSRIAAGRGSDADGEPRRPPAHAPTATETPAPTAVIGGPTAPTATAPTRDRADAPSPTPPTPAASASLWVLAGTGSSLEPASMTWSGPLALDGTTSSPATSMRAVGRTSSSRRTAEQTGGGAGLRYVVVRAGRRRVRRRRPGSTCPTSPRRPREP